MSKHLIQLSDMSQLCIHELEAFAQPFHITTIDNELLLLDLEQIITVVAADCHDRQVISVSDWQSILVVHQVIQQIEVHLQILWKETQHPLVVQ